jgi:hypothetical protein
VRTAIATTADRADRVGIGRIAATEEIGEIALPAARVKTRPQ